jgi:cytochrome P450
LWWVKVPMFLGQLGARVLVRRGRSPAARRRRCGVLSITVKRTEALRPAIQKIVDELIEAMLAGPKPVDLVTALGLPVPTLVITELLGVPYEDSEWFHRMSGVAR